MNQEIKKEWVAALRSGDYEQGGGCLRDQDNRFCCWGVLCDLYDRHYNGKHWVNREEMFGQTAQPPDEIRDWAGGINNDIVATLIEMNDGNIMLRAKPKKFSEIADYIKENL